MTSAPAVVPTSVDISALHLRGKIELERSRRSMLYWVERYCWTRDEKDAENPYKVLIGGRRAVDRETLVCRELLDERDDYLRYLTLLWETEKLLCVPKSRQLRISWWAMGMMTGLAQFNIAQRIAVQSKQLGDADKLLDRAVVILELQRKVAPWINWPPYKKKFGLVTIEHGGIMGISRIEALAQGAGKIRGEAYSAIFSDEQAFQAEAEEAYTAAMPLLEQGARYLCVSSAAASTFFERLQNDAI